MSKIRVTFNRQVTWAELETFRAELVDLIQQEPDNKITWHFTEDRQKVYLDSPHLDSRTLYADVSDWAASAVVNLHPTAVRTFSDSVTDPAPREVDMSLNEFMALLDGAV